MVLVTYTLVPTALLRSLEDIMRECDLYVVHHGPSREIESQVRILSYKYGFEFVSYRENRGLSKSWNEGIRRSVERGNEFTMLLNDDLVFRPNAARKFIEAARTETSAGVWYLVGLEAGGSPYAGKVVDQGMACAILSNECIETVGYFDECFTPAYYEDWDYIRRYKLAGIESFTVEEILVDHERSATVRSDPRLMKRILDSQAVSGEYYRVKWGGRPGEETFDRPFGREPLRIGWEERDASVRWAIVDEMAQGAAP